MNIHELPMAVLCVDLGYSFLLCKWWHLCLGGNSDSFREHLVVAGICEGVRAFLLEKYINAKQKKITLMWLCLTVLKPSC